MFSVIVGLQSSRTKNENSSAPLPAAVSEQWSLQAAFWGTPFCPELGMTFLAGSSKCRKLQRAMDGRNVICCQIPLLLSGLSQESRAWKCTYMSVSLDTRPPPSAPFSIYKAVDGVLWLWKPNEQQLERVQREVTRRLRGLGSLPDL